MAAKPFGAPWYGWNQIDPRLAPTDIGAGPPSPRQIVHPVHRRVPVHSPPPAAVDDHEAEAEHHADTAGVPVRIRRNEAATPTPLAVVEQRPANDRLRLREAVAELEAAKGRVERDAQRVQQQTQAKIVAELLPVLDNLDRSIQAAGGHADPALLTGLKMVVAQFEGVLQGFGLERIAAQGQPFDPAVHDAVAVAPVDDPRDDRRVVDEIAAGYRFGQSLLRPAKVRVGKLTALVGTAPAHPDAAAQPDDAE